MESFVNGDRKFYFTAVDKESEMYQIWSSEGNTHGAKKLWQFNAKSSEYNEISQITRVGSDLIWVSPGRQIWPSDFWAWHDIVE